MKKPQYRIGSCLLDCQTMTLNNGKLSTKLPAKVFELLSLFLASAEYVVGRQEAIDTIWLGNEAVGKRGFTNAIWTLRKVFKELGVEDDIFLTLPKVGYQLCLSVAPVDVSNDVITVDNSRVKKLAFFAVIIAVMVVSAYFLNNRTVDKIMPNQNVEEYTRVTNYEGVEEHPAVSHNGKYLAFQWFRDGYKGSVYIKELNKRSTPLKLVTMSSDEEASPAWSASDSSLAYVRILADGQCQIRARRLVTHEDILIDEDCYYQPFKRVISWSNQHDDTLLYSKNVGSGAAIFSFDFNTKAIKQVTFPEGNTVDFAPHFSSDNTQIAFIRAKRTQQFSLLVQNGDQSLTTLLKDQVSIIDLDWDYENNSIYVNYSAAGKFILERLSLDGAERKLISNFGLPSNLSLNSVRKELYFSDYISKEYIVQLGFEQGNILRKISSSSRDMYGRYVAKTDDIMFLSNRSNYWSLWLNNKIESINFSKNLGNATVPAISPDSKTFAVTITPQDGGNAQLYLGTIATGQLQKLTTDGLLAENLSWSRDGRALYFSASANKSAGIYRLAIANNDIEQLTHDGEFYAIEGADGKLYYSKNNQTGIWQLDLLTMQSSVITDELATYDYGAFFWQNDSIVYLHRDKDLDQIKRIHLGVDSTEEVLLTYPINTIRKYFGISEANESSFIATLKITNEADISAISVTAYPDNP